MITMWLCILSFFLGIATMLVIGWLLERKQQIQLTKPHDCERDGHKYSQWSKTTATVHNREMVINGITIQIRTCDVCGFQELEEM